MSDIHYELKSGVHLLCEARNGRLFVNLDCFYHEIVPPDTIEHKTEEMLEFIRDTNVINRVEIHYHGVPDDAPDIVLRVTEAYHGRLAFHPMEHHELKLTIRHWDARLPGILTHEICKNTITHLDLGVNDGTATLGIEALGTLTKLGTLTLSILFDLSLLESLTNVNFSASLKALSIGIYEQGDENKVLAFLQAKPQIEEFEILVRRRFQRLFQPELERFLRQTLTKDSEYDLRGLTSMKLRLAPSAPAPASLTSTLTSIIPNLSPRIRFLEWNLNYLEEAVGEKLNDELVSAMDQNTDTLDLLHFKVEWGIMRGTWRSQKTRLCSGCGDFVAKKMIGKATSADYSLPAAALPRALQAIEDHEALDLEPYKATLLYHVIRNSHSVPEHIGKNGYLTENRKRTRNSDSVEDED